MTTAVQSTFTNPQPSAVAQAELPRETDTATITPGTYAYRAFGAAWQGGNCSANAYRYAGEYGYTRDSAAVEYVRARYLNVLQGRWMSADPLRFEAGDYNLYRYVGNQPAGGIDYETLNPLNKANVRYRMSRAPKCQQISKKCLSYILTQYETNRSGGGAIVRIYPHAASDILGCACKYGVSDVLLLAIAWCESHFGKSGTGSTNDPRHLHNPFSCHLCPRAKGLARLNECNGCLPTIAQSACCTAATISRDGGLKGGVWGGGTITCAPIMVRHFLNICNAKHL